MSPTELEAYAGEAAPGTTVLYHRFLELASKMAIDHPGMLSRMIWKDCRDKFVPGTTSAVGIPD